MYKEIRVTPQQLDLWALGNKVCITYINGSATASNIIDNNELATPNPNSTYYGTLRSFSLHSNGLFVVYFSDRSEPLSLNWRNGTCTIKYYQEIEEND